MERKTAAILLFLFCFVVFLGFNIWFVSGGGLDEPLSQLMSFFKKTRISHQDISLESLRILVGFLLLDLYVSVAVAFLVSAILRKKPKMVSHDEYLRLPLFSMYLRILPMVALEEVAFRWFPLRVLFPFWGTHFALWATIVISSLVFGLVHIGNQESDKNLFFTLPQILGGVMMSYIFLAFGFWVAVAEHFLFDAILFTFAWAGYRIERG